MTSSRPGYQPNPLRPLIVVVTAFGVVVLGVVAGLFLRAEPRVPTAVQQAGVVVKEFDLSTGSLAGPPRTTFLVAVDVVPAAVLDVDDVDFGGRTFFAVWYDASGDPWLAVKGKAPQAFTGKPIVPSGSPINTTGPMTFVFGTWVASGKRFDQVYARTEVRLVGRR